MTRSLLISLVAAALAVALMPACDDESGLVVGCTNDGESGSDGRCNAESNQADPPQAGPQEAPEQALQALGLQSGSVLGLSGPRQADGAGAGEAVEEDAIERVEWALPERTLLNYLAWQRSLQEAQDLSEIANQVLNDGEEDEALRREAERFSNPAPAAESLARFGLSQEDVQHLEELLTSLANVRETDVLPVHDRTAELARAGGASARRFVEAVQAHQRKSLRERTEPMRQRFGDANVELLLKLEDQVPQTFIPLESDAAEGGNAER